MIAGQALPRRLTHARFADQRRIVLVAPGTVNDLFDFHLTPDDRVEFTVFRLGGQINSQLVNQRFLDGSLFLSVPVSSLEP